MKTYLTQGSKVNESLDPLLRSARLQLHDLANRASIDRTLMDRWRQNQQSLGIERYRRVASVLGVGIGELPLISTEMLVETHGVWYRLGAFPSKDGWIARVDELDLGSLPSETANGRLGVTLPGPMDPQQAESDNVQAPMNFHWEGYGPDAKTALTELAERIDRALESVIQRDHFRPNARS
jgi:transcriptional regulator with XRE-family HTH domain